MKIPVWNIGHLIFLHTHLRRSSMAHHCGAHDVPHRLYALLLPVGGPTDRPTDRSIDPSLADWSRRHRLGVLCIRGRRGAHLCSPSQFGWMDFNGVISSTFDSRARANFFRKLPSSLWRASLIPKKVDARSLARSLSRSSTRGKSAGLAFGGPPARRISADGRTDDFSHLIAAPF